MRRVLYNLRSSQTMHLSHNILNLLWEITHIEAESNDNIIYYNKKSQQNGVKIVNHLSNSVSSCYR